MEDLQSCETRAAGSWTAFMALAGMCPALAQALHCEERPGESRHSVFFAWALLLAYVRADSTRSWVCGKLRNAIVQCEPRVLVVLCCLFST
jgi:hypothetical protein